MQKLTESHYKRLCTMVAPDRISDGESNRRLHVKDVSAHVGRLPQAIIWPVSTQEVSNILSWTYQEGIAVTPWGAGTSLEGNPVPVRGGLVMDFNRMNEIRAIRANDLQADVQPGVSRKTLNKEAGRHGLFFPPDPGADATIGGMIANNASGVQTVKYGATKDFVMRLVVVLPDGRVVHTGCKARKSSSGYDLTRLFVGSEGTLGVFTEATLRLAGIPEHFLAVTVTFDRLQDASEAVATLIGSGIDPAALELLTPGLIALMNRERSLGLTEKPSLFCEFHGISPAALEESVGFARELCQSCNASDFKYAIEAGHRQDLWKARHEAWETIHRAHIGKEPLIVDAAVPISHYPQMVLHAQDILNRTGAVGYIFGHAGDGNLHLVLVGDINDNRAWRRLEKVNREVVIKAIELGGTCTGEHGVGIGKRQFMEMEHGDGYGLMRELKDMIDPKGLMNPGKIFFQSSD